MSKMVSLVEFKTRTVEAGHPDGRPDRDVLILEVASKESGYVWATHRFSANWNPRSFSIEKGEHGYELHYLVGDPPQEASRFLF